MTAAETFAEIENAAGATLTVEENWGPILGLLRVWFDSDLEISAPVTQRFGPTGPLEISGVVAEPLSGRLSWPADAAVHIKLTVVPPTGEVEERLDAVVTLQAPPGWTFSDSFGDLPETMDLRSLSELTAAPMLDSLKVESSWLVVSTGSVDQEFVSDGKTDRVSLAPGAGFVVRCRPPTLTGGLLDESAAITLSGPIVAEDAGSERVLSDLQLPFEVSDLPGVHLQGPLGTEIDVGELKFAVHAGIYSSLTADWLERNPACRPMVALVGDLTINNTNVTVRLLSERGVAADDSVEFVARFAAGQHDGIMVDDLAAIISDDHEPGFLRAHLPQAVASVIDSVTLRGLTVTVNTSGGTRWIANTGLYLGLDVGQISLIPGVLEFDGVDGIEIMVRNPFGSTELLSDRVRGVVAFRAEFLDEPIAGFIGLPYFEIDLQLIGTATIPLSNVFAHHEIAPAEGPSGLVVEDFAVQADLDGYFAIGGQVAGSPSWSVDIGKTTATLENVTFHTAHSRTGAKTASFGATLDLGPSTNAGEKAVTIFVNADLRSGDPASWRFTGGMQPVEPLAVGELVSSLAHHFGTVTVPDSIAGLVVDEFYVEFDTGHSDFTAAMAIEFPMDGTETLVRLGLDIRARDDGTGYDKQFTVTFDDLTFELADTADMTVASYEGTTRIHPLQLVAALSDDSSQGLADSIELSINSASFVHQRPVTEPSPGRPGRYLFDISLDGRLDLTQLPLVGDGLPRDVFAIDELSFALASAALAKDDVAAIAASLSAGAAATLPIDVDGSIAKGPSIAAKMTWNGGSQDVAITASEPTDDVPTVDRPPAPSTPAVPSGAKWFDVQRTFGPLRVSRVGLRYQDDILWALVDASLTVGPLAIGLDGLAAGSSLTEFEPHADLRGLSVDYSQGDIEIGGAFRRIRGDIPAEDEYAGVAIIRTPTFSLSALGSYAKRGDDVSLFIYGVLDYPLGGPAFFFVTGLAAGFGYNRSLRLPAIEDVASFPLVSEVIHPPGAPRNLDDVLQDLSQDAPVDLGEMFLCAGVRFSTFKLIDSFALVAARFGSRFELDVLGLSTLVVPAAEGQEGDVTPLAEVQMAVVASFVPEEGFLGVKAQLTPNSYLFSRACHLTGGFAFFTWFKDGALGAKAGDFVFTLGGYHPAYRKPAHYPNVPRVGVSWQVSPELKIKGGMYYALTGNALMAGGALQATWDSGSLKAWFTIKADFLIAWKPYHYDAHVTVDLGVSFTFHFFGTHTVTLDLGADLHIWGPEFSGYAKIHIAGFTIGMKFGASDKKAAEPIDWPSFQSAFLPAGPSICSVLVAAGIVGKTPDDDGSLGVVNPKDIVLALNSAVPITEIVLAGSAPTAASTKLHIAPMGVTDALKSVATITVTRGGGDATLEFVASPIYKRVPRALWGDSFEVDLAADALLDDVVMGYELRPAVGPQAGRVSGIARDDMQFSTALADTRLGLSSVTPTTSQRRDDGRQRLDNTVTEQATVDARDALLTRWGFTDTDTVNLQPGYGANLLGNPRVVAND